MYVKIIKGAVAKFPYTVANLRSENPMTSFPRNITDELFASYGVFPVVIADKPTEFDPAKEEVIRNGKPVQIDGVWTLTWSIMPLDRVERETSREDREAMVRKEASRRLRSLAETYSAEERQTWATQVDESKALLAGETPFTNMVPLLAERRGVTVEQMAQHILNKAAQFAHAGGIILGCQAKLVAMDIIPSNYKDDEYWT